MKLYFFKIFALVYVALVNGCLSYILLESSNTEKVEFETPYDFIRMLRDIPSHLRNFSNWMTFSSDVKTAFNSSCYKDTVYFLQNVANLENLWALKLLDSYGKPESGILEGNLNWLGNYHECVTTHAPSKGNTNTGNFYGRYCTLQYSAKKLLGNLSVTSGICIPDTCNSDEFLGIARSIPALNETLTSMNATLTCLPIPRPLDVPAIAVIALLCFFGLLAVLGSSVTAYEHFSAQDVSVEDDLLFARTHGYFKKCKPFLKCFCVFTNGSKLLNTDASEGQLLCLHGIRFLSMTWVILCHSFSITRGVIGNPLEALNLIDNIAFQIVPNGFYSVDSFFVLSAFLLTYLFLKEYGKRKGHMPWVHFYVHRYIRLTPVYMIVLAFSSSLFMYLGCGPYWSGSDLYPSCKHSWWWNLLYINNFQPTQDQCMAYTWYLANDMQFFIISPLFIISLYRWPKVGFSLLGTCLIATCLANFFITYHYNLIAGFSDFEAVSQNFEAFAQKWSDYYDLIYDKPYTRIGPYLVGIFLGYILFKIKTTNRPKFGWITLCCGWAIASAVTLACVYGTYHSHPSVLEASFINAFSRTCFGAGLAWVIYVCLTNQGGFVNSILSYKLFIPLSRLTYCAYLIHSLIITAYVGNMKTSLHYSHATLVTLFLGFLTATYMVSLIVSLLFEAPLIGLEKIVRNKFK